MARSILASSNSPISARAITIGPLLLTDACAQNLEFEYAIVSSTVPEPQRLVLALQHGKVLRVEQPAPEALVQRVPWPFPESLAPLRLAVGDPLDEATFVQELLARCPDGEGVCVAPFRRDRLERCRREIPALGHRKL